MLRQRLIFGTLMVLMFLAAMLLDGWLDGSISRSETPYPLQAVILWIVVSALIILGSIEFSKLAERVGAKTFLPITIPASLIIAAVPYLARLSPAVSLWSIYFLPAALAAVLFTQAVTYGTKGTILNCGSACFSMIYLGLFTRFVVDIRLDFGLRALFMFVFCVKVADIGAYTAGRLFGKHKFAPRISPGKTWQGMGGALIAAALLGSIFAASSGIMNWLVGTVFGVLAAFVGQLADLAESMLKRDAQQKDSSDKVPGFGGVLDVVDSLLITAPVAYCFFKIVMG
ncbi:MAG: phosphatidate cytidylyltransferase [Planctomycetota bacterium]